MILNIIRHRVLTTVILSLMVSTTLWPAAVNAQESDTWEFRVTPYLWMLGLEGTTAVLGQDTDVDAGFSDIFDALNIALSVNMELSKGQFFMVLDPMYAQLEIDFTGPDPVGGKIDIDLVIADLNFGYSFDENFGVYAGARYYNQDITIMPNMLPQIGLGDDWTDIIVGLRASGRVSENWSFAGKMDAAVGGDSDSAYYFNAVLLRHFGDNKHLDIGWRHYDVDYESGSGLTRFKWDVEHTGPVVGFTWEFGG